MIRRSRRTASGTDNNAGGPATQLPDLAIRPARLAWSDTMALGSQGLTTRKARTVLSALGIAIGIAALVAVMGLSASSKADLMTQLDSLGTNLLRVSAGQSLTGGDASLPSTAPDMVSRVATVEDVASTYVTKANVYRNQAIPEEQSSGLSVMGADLNLPDTLRAQMQWGRWLDAATQRYPAVVLGAKAAQRLGVTDSGRPVAVWIGGHKFAVVGVLKPAALAPELDSAALIGAPIARQLFGTPPAAADANAQPDVPPATIYTRVERSTIDETRRVLARTANPANPGEVSVSRPSEALTAQAAADKSLTTLSLGLGGVGLLVGGVGIANVMVVAVLERRREIGVRRALGATRGAIRTQFIIESMLLAALGGACGALLGTAASAGFAVAQHWQAVIAWPAVGVGLAGSLLIGAIAGSYPAMRAAKVSPTEALRAV